jgi:hypothetical protein
MRKSYNFLIESERSGHKLLLNGQEIATFTTLDAAEAEANKIANHAVPGANLRFELDFMWTLTDLEMRAATLDLRA